MSVSPAQVNPTSGSDRPFVKKEIMVENQTALSALKRNWEMVALAVAEVDEATMVARPNSMSWLIRHMTRVADRFIHFRLTDKPQLWTADV